MLDEYADINPRAWPEVLRPALADRKGWAVFIGTPRGRNDFWRVHQYAEQIPTWFSLVLRASETGILPQSELDDMRGMLTAEQYQQEFECLVRCSDPRCYYGRELAEAEAAGRIANVPYDPLSQCIPRGISASATAPPSGSSRSSRAEVHVIDYYEASGHGLPHYAVSAGIARLHLRHRLSAARRQARQLGTGRPL